MGEKLFKLDEWIVRYRAKYNLTQAEFAKLCGVTTQTIGAIEAGRHGTTRLTQAKIIQVLEKG